MNIKYISDKAKDNIASGKCPCCDGKVDSSKFKDELSLKEFNQSGMCQKCQDDVFSGF